MFYRLRTRVAVGLVAAIAAFVPIAYAAGLFPGLPIVGEAAYCPGYSSYATGTTQPTTSPSTPNNCNATAPAGPGALSGNEVVIADIPTNTNAGPSSVYIPSPSGASGVYDYVANASLQPSSLNGTGTFTVPNLINNVILDPTGSLTALTVTLPVGPLDGQIVRIVTSQAVTPTLVITPSSAATKVKNAPATLGTTTSTGPWSASFIYNLAQNIWYRL